MAIDEELALVPIPVCAMKADNGLMWTTDAGDVYEVFGLDPEGEE